MVLQLLCRLRYVTIVRDGWRHEQVLAYVLTSLVMIRRIVVLIFREYSDILTASA